MAAALKASGLRLDAMNVHGGNYPGGERGFASDPGRTAAFREALSTCMRTGGVATTATALDRLALLQASRGDHVAAAA